MIAATDADAIPPPIHHSRWWWLSATFRRSALPASSGLGG
jgi:hypothetical protein